MAITRRQFVTRLGALAAAVGFSQADVSKLAEAFAANSTNFGGTLQKPKVVWVHGAECTGCSTSLLGIFEDPAGDIYGTGLTTGAAVTAAGVTASVPNADSTLLSIAGATRTTVYNQYGGATYGDEHVNIADVVIDVIDLQYHETVMSMGGDLAAKWLNDFANYTPVVGGSAPGDVPFVLVVEGALQDKSKGGAWSDTAGNGKSWCSIGMSDNYAEGGAGFEVDMAETVVALAKKSTCAAIIPIGQCAAFGGYPGARARLGSDTEFDVAQSQTGAMGVYQYLTQNNVADTAAVAAAAKVVNVPGCPTNPWWFVLTVVMIMVDLKGVLGGTGPVLGVLTGAGAPNPSAVDYGRRLKAVYPIPVHSAYCPRYPYYNQGVYAAKPGDPGCLQKLGCKGISTRSLCGVHGWNNQQPENANSLASLNGGRGGHCTKSGHPCMACTEKGYPDSFVPFIKRF